MAFKICRAGMLMLSCLAVWCLVYYPEAHPRRKWGCIFGLLSQPFWAGYAYISDDWILLLITGLYTVAWIHGIRVQRKRGAEDGYTAEQAAE